MRIEFTADDHSFDLNFKEAVYIKGEDGKNLEFLWNGTKLGVRQEWQTEYQFVELKGETGEQGETGNGIDHITLNPDYTLTVYYTDGTEYVTAPIRGAKGDKGDKGDTGEQGPQGIQGTQGPAGQNGTDGKDGEDGTTPTIGENGNWYLGSTDTGKPSRGAQGPQGATGQDGDDGVSPTITSTSITGGHRLTITDVDGTRTVDVLDGENGADGTDGEDGKSIYAGSAVPTTDGYNIGDLFVLLTNGQVYVLDDDPLLRWRDTGYTIKGAPGADGKSAYRSAQDGGYTGTETQFNSDLADVGGKYAKPTGGIPKTDLASDVQSSLNKADSALQEHQSLSAYSTTVQMNAAISAHHDITKQDTITDLATIRAGAEAGATAYQKPSTGIPASDLASGVIPTVPTALSQLSADSTHRVVTDAEKSTWNSKQNSLGFTPENAANKVTSISSSSTDTQYPSAKAVYSYIQSLDGNGVSY